MTFDYACCKNLSGKASWTGQVRLITTVDPYELTVTARNSSFHIICGTYTHGNFLCIPDLGVSTPPAALNDTFWNLKMLDGGAYNLTDNNIYDSANFRTSPLFERLSIIYTNTGSLAFRSNNRHQLPSDPSVAGNALAYSLSSQLAR
ncbi:hypothetical protein [Acetobacterium wieringae]|nr:hypothetical protein [Acetobacterium wieringae]